jgi:hypothetical protein
LRKESKVKTIRFGKFLRLVAIAGALAITTAVGIPAQPASAMTYDQCHALVENYNDAIALGDVYAFFGWNNAAVFHYKRAGAIAETFGELC